MSKSEERFSEVVKLYARFRPQYPSHILSILEERCGLTKSSIIADVGSGTGLLSRLFLAHGNVVYGIEPNDSMRQMGEELLQEFSQFYSVAGSAEDTTLSANSVDFVTAGTAFHWFDPELAKKEFQRILRTQGFVILIWNVRDHAGSEMMQAYENLLYRFGSLSKEKEALRFEKTVPAGFFLAHSMENFILPNTQVVDFEGLRGRFLSTSYVIKETHPDFPQLLKALKDLFNDYQQSGTITLSYQTHVVLGQF